LAATIKYHLAKEGSAVSQNISKNLYVDNLVTGVASSDEAIAFYSKAKEIFKSASMNIREWASNSNEFLQQVSDCDQVSTNTLSVLGYVWNAQADVFTVAEPFNQSGESITKRNILSFIASYYDPLGFFAPVFIPAKLLLQQLWLDKVSWDEPLSEEKCLGWGRIVEGMLPVPQLSIPRFIGIPGLESSIYTLHCFCDASQKAYGTCVYICISNLKLLFSSNLVFAKARVSPLDGITLPRLELLAVHIGSKALSYVESSLPFPVLKKYLGTDSHVFFTGCNQRCPFLSAIEFPAIKAVENVEYRCSYS
jgi:Pao retrotransposon peptidase